MAAAAWSMSRLKDFEGCPFRYHRTKVAKLYSEPPNEAMRFGDLFHKALEKRVKQGVPLPPSFEKYEELVEVWDRFEGKVWCEYKLALTDDRAVTSWMAGNVALRVIADVMAIAGSEMAIVDYKTGKYRDEDSEQLDVLMAAFLCAFPTIEVVHGALYYTQTEMPVRATLRRAGIDGVFMAMAPRVATLRQAHELDHWEKRKSRACKWCIVSECEHHGGAG